MSIIDEDEKDKKDFYCCRNSDMRIVGKEEIKTVEVDINEKIEYEDVIMRFIPDYDEAKKLGMGGKEQLRTLANLTEIKIRKLTQIVKQLILNGKICEIYNTKGHNTHILYRYR